MTRADRENEALKKARELLPKIYAKYPTGGPMHVVLDDGNFETCHIIWSLVYALQKDAPEEDWYMFMDMAEYLLDMPEKKRYKLWEGVTL